MKKRQVNLVVNTSTFEFNNPSRRVYFIDIMLGDKFDCTIRYKHCPAFRLDPEDVYNKVLEKRPSLKDKNFDMYLY